MALVLADRVKETTTTTGTGTVTLLGASTGFQSFAAVGNANTTYYTITAQTGTEWEVGIGTYTSVGTTLSRTTVLSSSNAGSLVNFSAGTKDVFVTYPSSRSIYADGTTLTATNSSILPVANGGTNASSASITAFNNITGYSAAGATGTTTTNLVFSTSPTLTTPLLGTPTSGVLTNCTGYTAANISGSISLTTQVSGTLPIANGGTNSTSAPTAGGAVYGTGTAYAITAAGTSGQVLTSAAAGVPTWTTATNANTASAIVQRDASGNFTAGTITAALTGNASTATSATSATTATNLAGGSAGNLNYQTGAGATAFITNGTTGQVLTSNGVSAPSWAAVGGGFPSGTAMLFVQTAAPTSWTKSTTHNNKALRVVSGTASSGGTVGFTTAFASQAVSGTIGNTTVSVSVSVSTSGTVGSTTLTTSQMPSHRHYVTNSGSSYTYGPAAATGNANGYGWYTDYEGGGASHDHSFSGSGSGSGSSSPHNHTFTGTAIDLAVQYVDVIIATKD